MGEFGVFQIREAVRLLHGNHDTGVIPAGRYEPTGDDAEATMKALLHHAEALVVAEGKALVEILERPEPPELAADAESSTSSPEPYLSPPPTRAQPTPSTSSAATTEGGTD